MYFSSHLITVLKTKPPPATRRAPRLLLLCADLGGGPPRPHLFHGQTGDEAEEPGNPPASQVPPPPAPRFPTQPESQETLHTLFQSLRQAAWSARGPPAGAAAAPTTRTEGTRPAPPHKPRAGTGHKQSPSAPHGVSDRGHCYRKGVTDRPREGWHGAFTRGSEGGRTMSPQTKPAGRGPARCWLTETPGGGLSPPSDTQSRWRSVLSDLSLTSEPLQLQETNDTFFLPPTARLGLTTFLREETETRGTLRQLSSGGGRGSPSRGADAELTNGTATHSSLRGGGWSQRFDGHAWTLLCAAAQASCFNVCRTGALRVR